MRCVGLALATPLARLVAGLSQSCLLRLACVLSWLAAPLLSRRRRIARINLGLCFPELSADARQALLRANEQATMMGLLELLRAWFAPPSRVAGMAHVDGLDLLREAIASGRGVLLLTAHFTCTELAARLVSESLGKPVRVVVRRNNSACMEAWLESARARVFGPTLAKKDVRGLLRSLQSGDAVVYSADQNFTYQNAFVPFFGVPAATLTSTPELLRRAGARMLVFFFHREDDGSYRLRITPAWPQWSEADPVSAAAVYMSALQEEVRRHPAQYLWFHRRFKTRPPGQPDLYA